MRCMRRAVSSVRMEPGADLVNEYVQSFELERLEDIQVKREANNNLAMVCDESTSLMEPPSLHHVKLPPMPIVPGHDYASLHPHGHPGHHQAHGVLMRAPGPLPFSPPDTPPEGSPPDQYHLNPNVASPIPCLHSQNPPSFDEHLGGGLVWLPMQQRQESPLDLRPCNDEMECWNKRSVITDIKRMASCNQDYRLTDELSPIATTRPQMRIGNCFPRSPCPPSYEPSDPSTKACIISDDQLVSLTVRELNKRLQPYPKELVTEFKAKRRTLKNRGYAQNCRSKRVKASKELELQNKTLVKELRMVKEELQKLSARCRCGAASNTIREKFPGIDAGIGVARYPCDSSAEKHM